LNGSTKQPVPSIFPAIPHHPCIVDAPLPVQLLAPIYSLLLSMPIAAQATPCSHENRALLSEFNEYEFLPARKTQFLITFTHNIEANRSPSKEATNQQLQNK
jgi:hypothetical protein